MKKLIPDYKKLDEGEAYYKNLHCEYQQSLEEGLDIEKYKELFETTQQLPDNEEKVKKADKIFNIVLNCPTRDGYEFNEPSDLEGIRKLRKEHKIENAVPDANKLFDKIYGAWLGRVCGCLLGKPCEGRRADVLIPFLKASENYPMYRYINESDFKDVFYKKYEGFEGCQCFADMIDRAPVDDDTNYTVLAQKLIETYGRDFTSENVIDYWVATQPKTAYFTAERVALINRINGFIPPDTALYKNPYREWIGAQIRGDYFGYINPANPELAAEMAFRDASISHVKNGIYGEMFVAAALACAAVTDNIEDVIFGGLAQIPATSRLYKEITELIRSIENGLTYDEFYAKLHADWDEFSTHGWCHTISNALIVVAALLYGNGDYGKTICLSVQSGFDTDCNAATAGSIIGMMYGTGAIDTEWTDPIQGRLNTSICNVGTVDISELARMTMKHII